jgi:hypothetical protein
MVLWLLTLFEFESMFHFIRSHPICLLTFHFLMDCLRYIVSFLLYLHPYWFPVTKSFVVLDHQNLVHCQVKWISGMGKCAL